MSARMKRLIRRKDWIQGVGALFMLGVVLGRASRGDSIYLFGVGVWMFNLFACFVPIYLEHRRERKELAELMRQVEAERRRWDRSLDN